MCFTVNVCSCDYRMPSHNDTGWNHVAYNLYELHYCMEKKKKKKPILCTVLSVTMTAHTIAAWLQFFNCSGCLNLSINISSFPDEIAEYPNEEFSSHS